VTKFLFVTDLDNTLVGDKAALMVLNDHLSQHRQQHGTVITYATGRSLTLFNQLSIEQSLLEPDFRVLSVGTEIYVQGSNTPDLTWAEQLAQNWHRDQVMAIAAHFADLVPQPATEQTPFKVSFFLTPEAATEVLPALESAFQQQGLEAQLVYSSNVDLDILPRRSNKGAAINFLQGKLGFAPEETVVCGDSGNDLSLFQLVKAKGIIVGNAQPELLDWHYENLSNLPENSQNGQRYLTQAHCSGGILEGLRHFGFLEN
jgi:sucrose-6-phosphatase